MFDIGWSEIFIVAVIALIVIGPRELPKVLYEIGKWVRRARGMAREFQRHFDDMVRDAELDDLKKQAMAVRNFNLKDTVQNTIDPEGDFRMEADAEKAKTDPSASPTPKLQPLAEGKGSVAGAEAAAPATPAAQPDGTSAASKQG